MAEEPEEVVEKAAFEIFGWEASEVKLMILFIVVIATCLSVIRLVYDKTKMKVHVPESTLLITIGLIVGFIIAFAQKEKGRIQSLLSFPAEVFLYIFVPVIIFDATYFLNKHAFFHNFLEIVTYAVIGTLISTVVIGVLLVLSRPAIKTDFTVYEHLTYASLVSAVDPVAVIAIMEAMHVNENIFNLAFGESTLNDGVAIVLFNLFKGIESLQEENKTMGQIIGLGIAKFLVSVSGAILLAVFLTLLFCYITKMTWKIPNIEPLLFLLCAMGVYVLADMLLFSGVIAVMTCALVLVRYGEYNMQPNSMQTFQTMIHMLAQTFETMLFLDMGFQIAFVARNEKNVDLFYCFMIIPFTIIARTVGTLVQTFFLNFRRKKIGEKLTLKDQVILIFCGLRGGIAFALSKAWELPEDKANMVVLATCILILFTIFAYGLSMRPLIKLFKIKLELHGETGYDFACKTLGKPAANLKHFAESLLGQETRVQRGFASVDRFLQRIFLRNPLPMDRELIDNVEQIKKLQIEKMEMEQQRIKDAEQAEWKKKYIRPSFKLNSKKKRYEDLQTESLVEEGVGGMSLMGNRPEGELIINDDEK